MTDAVSSRSHRTGLDGAAKAVLAAAASAWLAVLVLALSPWAADFSPGALERIGAHPWETATLAAGWMLMVVAMMLPTTLPLVSLFARTTAGRPDRRRGMAMLLLAYVAVWLGAGVALHLGDLGIHWLVRHSGWLGHNTWAIEAGTLAGAGAYQFSRLKARCLKRCRSPQSFVRRHWRGGNPRTEAWRMGLDHGVYCLGCCWTLMLVMFSVGVGNVAWMLALAAVMVAEKTLPVGPRVTAPVGAWLVAGAVATVVVG